MIGKGNQYEPGAHIGGAGAVHALKSGHGAVLSAALRQHLDIADYLK